MGTSCLYNTTKRFEHHEYPLMNVIIVIRCIVVSENLIQSARCSLGMNIKRHYITVITLFLTTLLVIFGLKDVLPRELYVGLSILMGMSLVISYSVLDIIGFFANKEWILEEEMWRFTPPTKQTVWGVWKLVTALMIMTIVFYLQDVKRDFFILPGFGAVSLGFFVFTYSFLVSVLTSMVSYPFGIYRFFSLISRNKGEAIVKS